jgi:sodium ion-translocating decarboxylase beta subunit
MQSINIGESLVKLAQTSGITALINSPLSLVMIAVSCLLIYLAIVKKYEPLLLLPIAFGMLLANLPLAGLMNPPTYEYFNEAMHQGTAGVPVYLADGSLVYQYIKQVGGLLYYLYQGVVLEIYPPLIFLGVGAMTDFGPLIANPKSLLLGAAAQLGVFLTLIGALLLGFTAAESSAIGIIGGADGPTAIYLTGKLAPHLLGPIAVAAYSYMALVPVIQPPIMRLLTTKKEREIVMEQLRPVSKREKIIFPIAVTIIVSLLLPAATPLIGMLMLGNLFRESGVVERLNKTSQNDLNNIVVIFLGVTVGATANAETFLNVKTLEIIVLGVFAFGFGTAGGVLLAKVMNKFGKSPVNPLIGSAGVSAVPMAARVSQVEGQKANPGNFLLMHAMGPNVAGVIGTAIAAGVLLSMFGT